MCIILILIKKLTKSFLVSVRITFTMAYRIFNIHLYNWRQIKSIIFKIHRFFINIYVMHQFLSIFYANFVKYFIQKIVSIMQSSKMQSFQLNVIYSLILLHPKQRFNTLFRLTFLTHWTSSILETNRQISQTYVTFSFWKQVTLKMMKVHTRFFGRSTRIHDFSSYNPLFDTD